LRTRWNDPEASRGFADDEADNLGVVQDGSADALHDPGDVLEPGGGSGAAAGGNLPTVPDQGFENFARKL